MAAYPTGIGSPEQALQATAAMRQEPWYQQLVRSWGLDPQGDANGNVRLSEDQQQQLLDEARNRGIGISDRYQIDENGQIAEQPSHLWRNIGIGAGIGGAMLIPGVGPAVLGALQSAGGAIGSAFGAGGGAGAAAGAIPATEGIASATALGLPVTAGLGTAGALGASAGLGTLGTLASGAAKLPDWLRTAQDVGTALSGASAGRAEGRMAEAQQNQAQNRAAVDLYRTELAAPGQIASNAVRGDILGNAQDVKITPPTGITLPTITGGLRPSMFSDATRQTGRNISNAAANTPIPSPTAPILPDLPQSSGLDTALNTGSTIGSLIGAARPVLSTIPWGKIFK